MQVQRLSEPTIVLPFVDLDDTELLQVLVGILRIEKGEPPGPQLPNEVDQRHLRRIAHLEKHRLAEEPTAECHAVQTARQFAVLPAFYAVGVSPLVQPTIGSDDPGGDPGPASVGAVSYHGLERSVGRHVEFATTNAPVEVVRDVEVVEREVGPGIGGVPVNAARFVVPHGKQAMGVGTEEKSGPERLGVGHGRIHAGELESVVLSGKNYEGPGEFTPVAHFVPSHSVPQSMKESDGQVYRALVDDRAFDVTIHEDRLVVDGESKDFTFEVLRDGYVSMIVDGKSVPVSIEETDGDTLRVTIDGRRTDVQVKDERDLLVDEFGLGDEGAGGGEIRAPMPGLVLDILVAEGDEVAAEQGLLVLEAMKMENELKAPAGGVVRTITTAEGEAVDKDALLIEIEAATEE